MTKRSFFFIAVLIVLVIVSTIAVLLVKESPARSVNLARSKLNEAEKIKSSEYASELYNKANRHFELAMSEWQIANEKIIFFRDYNKVTENAERASMLATEAIALTKDVSSTAEEFLSIRISKLEQLMSEFAMKYNNFPFNGEERNQYVTSKLLLTEGILAYKQMNYRTCKTKLDSSETIITILHETYEQRLEEYFDNYPEWKKAKNQTIVNSRKQHTYCIIVDKYARKCILYKSGKMVKSMETELGANWIGDKKQQGDKSTPEGAYKVISKKSNGASSYHKAFLLDYPNEDDKKRFALNIKNGSINQNASIGNLIEIHGNGGKGIDWTDGCIALKDSDMDALFEVCPVGTVVTIIGSINPLNELFSN